MCFVSTCRRDICRLPHSSIQALRRANSACMAPIGDPPKKVLGMSIVRFSKNCDCRYKRVNFISVILFRIWVCSPPELLLSVLCLPLRNIVVQKVSGCFKQTSLNRAYNCEEQWNILVQIIVNYCLFLFMIMIMIIIILLWIGNHWGIVSGEQWGRESEDAVPLGSMS